MTQRGASIIVVLLLLAVPAAGLALPLAPLAPGPLDVTDARLLRLLAMDVLALPPDLPVPDVRELPPLPELVLRVGARAGATLTPQDVVMFAGLDPRVDEPVRVMLAAVDQAWMLRDVAFASVPFEEQLALAAMLSAGEDASPRLVGVGVDQAILVQAAILLLDTAESVVVPQLEAAAASDAWPASAIADPVGILRIGGTGNDVETVDRVLQVDARGNDLYRNNAGASNLNDVFNNPAGLRYHVAMSLDLSGNDHYNETAHEAQGAAVFGIGVLLDAEGDDLYYCGRICQGAGSSGVGFARDHDGSDRYYGGIDNKGYAAQSIGVLRDDRGDDLYSCGGGCAGYAFLYPATGLLWDRDGADTYDSRRALDAFGWGSLSGRGWLADEGAEVDSYSTTAMTNGHGCNTCMWEAGFASNALPTKERGGRGNDNAGGLAALMGRQGSGFV